MQRTTSFSIVVLAGLWVLNSCGLQTPTAESTASSSDNGTYDCAAHQHQAETRLSAVVDAYKHCATDADCVSISLATACSDQCATSINQEGAKLLPAALSTINAEPCAGYLTANCQLMHPPCVPPPPPACVSGMCQ